MRARLTVGELAHQQADKPYNTGAISTTNCVKDVFKVFVKIKKIFDIFVFFDVFAIKN